MALEVSMGFHMSLRLKTRLSHKIQKTQGLQYGNIAAFLDLTTEQRWEGQRVLGEEP